MHSWFEICLILHTLGVYIIVIAGCSDAWCRPCYHTSIVFCLSWWDVKQMQSNSEFHGNGFGSTFCSLASFLLSFTHPTRVHLTFIWGHWLCVHKGRGQLALLLVSSNCDACHFTLKCMTYVETSMKEQSHEVRLHSDMFDGGTRAFTILFSGVCLRCMPSLCWAARRVIQTLADTDHIVCFRDCGECG